ncbi:MAG: S9 family peptidase, partial [Gemmatimonadota bacterium]|nr:S9 family peptidase [Gemmatimonadota bacterium]
MRTLPSKPSFARFVLPGIVAIIFASNAEAQEKPTLTTDDFGQWERLGGATLSGNGLWLATPVSRVNEENELRVHLIADPDSTIVVDYGSRPEFSPNGQWLAYSIGMSEDEREALQKQKKQPRSSVGLVDLGTGEVEALED